MMNSMTDRVRSVMVVLFVLTVLVGLGGWLFFDRDPGKLQALLMTVATGVITAEASAVGKRATFNPDAVGVEIPEAGTKSKKKARG